MLSILFIYIAGTRDFCSCSFGPLVYYFALLIFIEVFQYTLGNGGHQMMDEKEVSLLKLFYITEIYNNTQPFE